MGRALTGNGTGNAGAECFFIDYNLNSQSIAGNSSNISWWAYWHFYNSDRQLDNGYASLGDVTRWSNGGRVYNYAGNFTTRDLLVASGSFDLGHNSDGTKTMNVSGGLTGLSGYRSEGSNAIGLPAIPRAATITSAPNFNDEANPVVGYSNPAGNSVTLLQLSIFNPAGTVAYAGYRDISKTGSSYTFTLTSGERAALLAATPNSNTMTVRFYIKTTLGGVTYLNYAERTLTVVNGNPVFDATNISYLDTNATTVAITTNNQKIVQNISTLRGIFTAATALKSATIASYEVTLGTDVRTFTAAQAAINYGALNISVDTPLSIKAIDSRGNNVTAAKTVTFLPWSTPRAVITIGRVNNYEDSTNLQADVTIDSVDSKNTILSIQLKYKKTSDPSYTTTTMTTGVTKNLTLDKLYEWNIQIIVTDKFGSTTYNSLVQKGIPILFIDNGLLNIGINKFPTTGRILDIAGAVYIDNNKVLAAIDEDTMASNLDTRVPTQQSVKAYIKSLTTSEEGMAMVYGNRTITSSVPWQLYELWAVESRVSIPININDKIHFSWGSRYLSGTDTMERDLQLMINGSPVMSAIEIGSNMAVGMSHLYTATATTTLTVSIGMTVGGTGTITSYDSFLKWRIIRA